MDNQQKTPTQVEMGWFGGIIDGEGCVTVNRRQPKGKTSWLPKVSIVNTDPAIIQRAIEIASALSLPTYVQTHEYAIHGERRFKIELVWQGFKRCLRVLPVIIPYLYGKKQAKAIAMQEWITYRLGQPRGAAYTDLDTAFLMRIRQSAV